MSTEYLDVSGLKELAAAIGEKRKRIDLIAQQTLNAGARRGRTRVVDGYRNEIDIPRGYALSKVRLSPASFSNGQFEATISADKKGLLLSRFKYRSRRRQGVDVKVGKGSGFKRIAYAFVLHARNGTDVIAFRKPGQRKYNTLYGPSPSQVFESQSPQIRAELDVYMTGEMNRRINLELRGKSTLPPQG